MSEPTQVQQKRFKQIREAYLRQWYNETQSDNPRVRYTAQARFQSIRILRRQRAKIERIKARLSLLEATQDEAGARTVRKGLKSEKALRKWSAQVVRGQLAVTDAYIKRKAKQWRGRDHTLERVLDDIDLDTWADFWYVTELEAMEQDAGQDDEGKMRQRSESPLPVWVKGKVYRTGMF